MPPLNQKVLHTIDFHEKGAHQLYKKCACSPDAVYSVQDGVMVIIYQHNQFGSQSPDYKTVDENGVLVPDKSESVCS